MKEKKMYKWTNARQRTALMRYRIKDLTSEKVISRLLQEVESG